MSKNRDEFVFLPLGGSGEIGMNLNVFGFGPPSHRKYIIVDLGVTFGDLTTPGIDIIMPDIEFFKGIEKDLLGIVLTHAHEDHMGALARLWPELRCPVWATPFTMYLVKDRLDEAGLTGDVKLHEVGLEATFSIGPFDLRFIPLTHSIPEPSALTITTKLGTVFHTGDWKIDPNPLVGESINIKALEQIGDDGVIAMTCDSTNVFTPGEAGSELGVREELTKLIGEFEGKKIAVASFASNVARLSSVLHAANENDRSVCLVGRSMHRMVGAARAVGIIGNQPVLLDENEASQMPDGNILYLCTGSQGESRAALSRIAAGEHRNVSLNQGDAVIFSSKIIPGNEKTIFALQNQLAERGIEIVTEKSRDIHVSGHPCRDELTRMYGWIKPKIAIPVHGERRHLIEHARLAAELGVPRTHAPDNGQMIRLAPHGPKVIDIVPSGRLHQDGEMIVSANDEGLRQRRKMSFAGHVSVSLAVNKSGKIVGGPDPRISGFPEGRDGQGVENMLDDIADIVERKFDSLHPSVRKDEDKVEADIASAIRKYYRHQPGFKRPVVEVTVLAV
ncbi:ribonuclease J [Robiginitomaculum antarcticum]|uniref:ribonuclease J n=1 Tax=Robiginitomaculum antarcticum TaxID=437507 RepID=UPI0003A08CFB|nr:ribonuclease J [Robiginitomaculum antarcticum]